MLSDKVQELMSIVNRLDNGKFQIEDVKGDTGRLRLKTLRKEAAAQTAKLIYESYNETELRELCLDFHLSPEEFTGKTFKDTVINMITYFYRRRTLDVLIEWLRESRPLIQWPDTYLEE